MKMPTCYILLKGCCRTGLKVRRYLAIRTCAVIRKVGAWVLRNRKQGEEEDKKKVTWSTACRSREGCRVRAWSEGRKENFWFPEKKRVPSLCWCDWLKWWMPPSWALVWVICDQACSQWVLYCERRHMLCHLHWYHSAMTWFLSSPALSGDFFKLFQSTYLQRALISFNCMLRLGQASLPAPLLLVKTHPVCFLSSGHAVWTDWAARWKYPHATPLLRWAYLPHEFSLWHFVLDLLSAQCFPLYFNWSSQTGSMEIVLVTLHFIWCLLCATHCSKQFCINTHIY